jgi:hypothetical protein
MRFKTLKIPHHLSRLNIRIFTNKGHLIAFYIKKPHIKWYKIKPIIMTETFKKNKCILINSNTNNTKMVIRNCQNFKVLLKHIRKISSVKLLK